MASPSSSSSVSSDFSTFTSNLQKALVASSRTASSIPASRDVQYARTLNRQLGKKLDAQAGRTLHLTARLLAHSAQLLESSNTSTNKNKKGKSKEIEEEEDLTDGYQRNVVGITDGLLEKIDADLDLLRRGVTGKKAASISTSTSPSVQGNNAEEATPAASTSSSSLPSTSRLPRELLNATNLPKPQLLFLDMPNNSRDAVFLPLIKGKIHGITPTVSHEPEVFYDHYYTNEDGTAGGERSRIPNPYSEEIDKAIVDNPIPEFELQGGAAEAYENEGQLMQDGMHDKPFSFVNTLEGMKECLEKLKKEKVIAVDLEHHDYRSFRGFTSLIQISTVHEDFVLDPLVPEIRANAHILNKVFASPSIVKVLHGGEMDIIWLQRDFGIYVVNLFDTFHASRRIGRKTGHSLASLLTEYTSFHPDKRFQLADWRIRPLPAEMLNYARSDTHFLLFIFKRLLQDPVMEEHAINDIRRSSANTAKQVYEHLIYDKEGGRGHGGWRTLIEKNGKSVIWGIDLPLEGRRMGAGALSSFEAKALMSFEIFKAVHEWRDGLARQYDESWRYILSNKTLASTADLAPKDTQQLMQVLGHDNKGILRDHFQDLDNLLDETRKNVEKMISDLNASAPKPGSPKEVQAALTPAAPTLAAFALPASSASTSSSILFGVPKRRSSPPRSPKASRSLLPFLFPQNGVNKVKSNFEQIAEKVYASFGQLDAFKPSETRASRSPTPSRSPSPARDVDTPAVASAEAGPYTFAANGDHLFLSKKDRILANAAKSVEVKAEEQEDTEIVQVGKHKKNKKRKQGDAPPSTIKVKQEVEPFDYSTVKSVLDMKPEGEGSAGPSRKKQKKDKEAGNDKRKQTGLDYDFKSAPKSMNQPKSGNRSQTFTK